MFSLVLRLFSSIISLKSFKAFLTNQSKYVVFLANQVQNMIPALVTGDVFSRAFHSCHRLRVFPRFSLVPPVTCFPALSTRYDWFITVFAAVAVVHVAIVIFSDFSLEWNNLTTENAQDMNLTRSLTVVTLRSDACSMSHTFTFPPSHPLTTRVSETYKSTKVQHY